MFKDIFEELQFKFSHLGLLKPKNVKSHINLLDGFLSDSFIQEIYPNSYAFYMQFWNAAKQDPEVLKSLIYETKLIKTNKEKEAKIINKILAKLNNLYNLEMTDDVINNDDLYMQKKQRLMNFESERLKNRIKRIFANDEGNDAKVDKIIDDTFTPDTIENNDRKSGGGKSIVGGAGGDENNGPIYEGEVPPTIIAEPIDGSLLPATDTDQQGPVDGILLDSTDTNQQGPVDEVKEDTTIIAEPDDPSLLPTTDTNQPAVTQNQQGPGVLMSATILQFASQFNNETRADIESNIKPAMKKSDITEKDLEQLKTKLNEYKEVINDLMMQSSSNVIEGLSGILLPLQTEIDTTIKQIDDKLQKLKDGKIASEIKGEAIKSAHEEMKKQTEENDKKVKIKQKKKEDETKLGKDNLDRIRKSFLDRSILNKYQKRLRQILDNKTTTDAKLKASKLKDVIDDIENNDATTINSLAITKEDKLVFVGICFIIRLISLGIIDWALNTNYIVSFTHSYILYVILYCIFMLLMIAVVNITYRYPVYSLYNGNHGIFTALASVMYFFYLTPDYVLSSSVRIIVHFGIIIFLTTIAILIKSNQENNEQLLNYNYTEKKRIRRALSNFTLLLWFFTSVVAMYMF